MVEHVILRVATDQGALSDSGEALAWLLAGDPAIRWQTKRELLDATTAEVERERSLVA